MAAMDFGQLAESVKADLGELNDRFARLSRATLARIPRTAGDVPDFLTLTAAVLGSLSMLQSALFSRILAGRARLAFDREPAWAASYRSGWARLPERQPAAGREEPRLRSLLENLLSRIAYLDEETFANLPPNPDDVPEFFALVLLLERHLTWYLEPSLLGRLWPDRWQRSADREAADG